MSLGLLFPGQGSQHVGMGRGIAERHPAAARVFEEADDLLGFPLSRLAWEGPEEELTETRNAQPAILTHSVAVWATVRQRLSGAAMAAGHSLGEFSAWVAAGSLSFPDALEAVRLRGELMFASGTTRPGTMAAVLGLDDDDVRRVCRDASSEGSVCVPANLNSEGQVVISGDVDAVERASAGAKEAGAKRVLPLTVSGAFHSPLMRPAEEGLRARLEAVEFHDPDFPVVSNVTGGPVGRGADARDLLVRQLTAPVLWSASVAAMTAAGVDRFVELGPGNVLCALNRRNARGIPCRGLAAPDDLAQLDDWLTTTAASP